MKITIDIAISPQQLAERFWNMGSDEQAEFYAQLWRISDGKLCLQTAYIMDAIANRQINGDSDAVNAYRTMHAHSTDYIEVLVERMSRDK